MKKETTLWLLLLLVALGAAVWWQRGREEDDLGAIDVPLFGGVQIDRVKALDVDHVERGYTLRLERDARGAWYIVDPLVYPADLAAVRLLLEVVATGRALIVPKVERDPAILGFEPPRATFAVEERVEGEPVRHTIELGALDLDGRRVNVRKDGRYLRILRNLDTTLKRSVFDFRSQRAMQLDANEVVELNRTGQYQPRIEDVPVDLNLNAVRDGAVWRALAPRQATLDPLDVAVVTHGAAMLQVSTFADDAPVSLEEYGLAPAEFRIELRTSDGAREALRFGRKGWSDTWYVCREGEPYVWTAALEDVHRIVLSFDDLLDRHVLRVARDQVDALVLETEERVLRVARARDGWTVTRLGAAGEPDGAAHLAETGRVQGILSRLEHAELSGFVPDGGLPADAPRRGVFVEAGGLTFGGRLGPARTDADGREGVLFQRVGDDVVGLADPWLAELAATELDELRALALVRLDEIDLVALELERDGRTLRYVRDDRGRWSRAGEEAEATELLPVLDPLIFLRAGEHLPAGGAPLEDPIEVRLERRDGGVAAFAVGLLPGEQGTRTAVELAGARSTAHVAELHARLGELFAR